METIKLNLIPGSVAPVCHASQYDIGRKIKALLFDGASEYTLSNETISIDVRKPDGKFVTVSLTVVSGRNYVEIETTQQMCAVSGRNVCELKISKGTVIIGTANFYMDVEVDPTDGAIASASEIQDLQAQVNRDTELYLSQHGASGLGFDPTGTDLESTNVEAAIKEVNQKIEDLPDPTADNIEFDNDGTDLASTNVEDAIKEVNQKINNLPEPMVFKGTLGVNGTITSLPTASAENEGYTYKVITDGTYAGQSAKSGDVFVSNGSAWVLIPSGDEDNDTWRAIKVNGVEKLGNAISSGSVDFVDTDNVKFEFEANGNKVKATLSGIDTSAQVDEKVAGIIDDTEASENKAYSSSKVAELLGNKADVDGTYDNMTVGNAKQLKSNVGEVDKVPYLFRPSGGYIDIGESETDSLVGGTVAFNQLVNDSDYTAYGQGITVSKSNHEFTITTTIVAQILAFNSITKVPNHKYLVSAKMSTDTAGSTIKFRLNSSGSYIDFKPTSTKTLHSGIISDSGTVSDTYVRFALVNIASYTIDSVNIIDLTQMFGSTIADYIYSLEQGTAGAGVAWFRNLFPKSYYAYNAGTLMSVKTSKHIMTGFNAYDNSTGKAKVVGGNQYQITGTYTSLTLDGETITPNASGIFTPDTSGEITVVGGNATDTCIHFVWDGERNGEYEPYVKHEYDYSGEREVTRYFGIVDLGTLDFTYNSTYGVFQANLSTAPNNTGVGNMPNIICPKYTTITARGLSGSTGWVSYTGDKAISLGYDTARVIIKDTSYTDAQTFKTAISGVYLVYELATPYTETVSNPELRGIPKLDANNKLYYYGDTCSDLPNPQIVDDFGTEEYVDNRGVAIPVGHETFYQANLRAKLEMAPDSPSGDGDYIVRQTSGQNEYVPFVKELPTLPSTDGTYTLKVTVSGSTKTIFWLADT